MEIQNKHGMFHRLILTDRLEIKDSPGFEVELISTFLFLFLPLPTLNCPNLKVFEKGPLRYDVHKTYAETLRKVTFGWKGRVKVTFNSPFLNLEDPISN